MFNHSVSEPGDSGAEQVEHGSPAPLSRIIRGLVREDQHHPVFSFGLMCPTGFVDRAHYGSERWYWESTVCDVTSSTCVRHIQVLSSWAGFLLLSTSTCLVGGGRQRGILRDAWHRVCLAPLYQKQH